MSVESASNGAKNQLFDDGNIISTDDKSRRHPRWTRQETLTLIQAKEITENSPHKGRKINSASLGGTSLSSSSLSFDNTEPKWVMISSYCKQQGVKRGPAQCRKRWSNLIGDYKKVKVWESKLKDKADSFWTMRNDLRKEKKLPVSFDIEVYKVLEGRETGAVGAISPLPLQAVASAAAAAAAVSENGNECGSDEEEEDVAEEMEEEREEMLNGEREILDVKDDLMIDVKNGEQEILVVEQMEEIPVVKQETADNVTESPAKKSCTPEPISGTEEQHHQVFPEQNKTLEHDISRESGQGIEEQHHQVFQEQNKNSEHETDDLRESGQGFCNLDSQEGKRRRLSTDDHKSNGLEAHVLKILETNNKLLHAQLDIHNKNCQLEREQRKENNDALIATLGKLTDVLTKIAEKL